jgi:hypothetical protein
VVAKGLLHSFYKREILRLKQNAEIHNNVGAAHYSSSHRYMCSTCDLFIFIDQTHIAGKSSSQFGVASRCPYFSWKEHGGSCYLVMVDKDYTFDEAVDECNRKTTGSKPASIINPEQNEFVRDAAMNGVEARDDFLRRVHREERGPRQIWLGLQHGKL